MTDESGLDTGAPPPIERVSIRRNAAHMATSQIVTWTLATTSAIIVPRFLGPATLGRLQLAWSLWAIAGVFAALGTSMHLQLTMARDERAGMAMVAPVLASRTLAFALASCVLAAYVAVMGENAEFWALVGCVGLATLLAQWSDVYGAAFTGLETMGLLAGVSAAMRLVNLVLTVGVLVLGFGMFGVVAVVIATSLISLVILARRLHRIASIPMSARFEQLRDVVVDSAPFMAVTLALIVYRQVDVIVISRVAGDRDVGWYAAADVLAGSLLFPTTVMMTSVFPVFGRLHTDDPERLRNLVRRTFSLLLLASVPIGLGAAIVGPTFGPLLFGDKFGGTGEALVIFGPVTILTFGSTLLAYLALATDRRRFLATLIAISAVVTVPLDAWLVPWTADRYDNGAIGGALAYVVTELLQFVVGLKVIAPYLITRGVAWRSARTLAAGGVMVAATLPLRHQLFVVPMLVGVTVYPLALFAFRVIDDDQRGMVADVLRRLGIRTRSAS